MRTKDFDPDLALERAMHLFWSQGYEATGITDLTEHLGIARASLYATFGSKSQLYQRALNRYCTRQARPHLEVLDGPGPFLPLIEQILHHLADATAGDQARRGCMVVNAASERIPADAETSRQVEEHLRHEQQVLRRALERAQGAGEVRSDQTATAQAGFLVATILGLRVLGKALADTDQLHDVVEIALNALQPPHR